jgi:hypothetical protein
MISNSHHNYQHLIDKVHCDIFFSQKDITALRWISELQKKTQPYQDYIIINFYEIQSEEARKMNIYSESVLINNQKVEFYEINKALFELANEYVNLKKEIELINHSE